MRRNLGIGGTRGGRVKRASALTTSVSRNGRRETAKWRLWDGVACLRRPVARGILGGFCLRWPVCWRRRERRRWGGIYKEAAKGERAAGGRWRVFLSAAGCE